MDSLNGPEPESTENENSLQPAEEKEVGERLMTTNAAEKNTSIRRSRKHRKLDEVDLKIMKALEPPKSNSKMSFFESMYAPSPGTI